MTEEQPPGGGQPGDQPTGEPDAVGSLAEEAEKLLGALSGWATQAGGGAAQGFGAAAEQAAEAARGVSDHLATGAPECQWCPVCRIVHAVRDTDPEVRAHLAAAAASFVQALAGLMATRAPDPSGPAGGGPAVEHIDVGDEWPGQRSEGWDPEHPGAGR